MAAIGDVSRMSILYILAHGTHDVREIIDITGLSPALASHHLGILKKNGWVSRVAFGKRAEYSLDTRAFDVLHKLFVQTPLGRTLVMSDK